MIPQSSAEQFQAELADLYALAQDTLKAEREGRKQADIGTGVVTVTTPVKPKTRAEIEADRINRAACERATRLWCEMQV